MKSLKEKYQNDIQYRLKIILRSIVYSALKYQNARKLTKSIDLLGILYQDYKQYIENQFFPEFVWSNHGVIWEIDHIKPLSKFDLRDPEQ